MIDVKQSKCWTCKYGICIKESGEERFVHPAPPTEHDHEFEAFGDKDQEQDAPMHEHVFQTEAIKAFCFWRPTEVQNAPPMMQSFVNECSRYKKASVLDE